MSCQILPLQECQKMMLIAQIFNLLISAGSAAAVEHFFSGGWDTIGLRRASLKAENIKTLMFVKVHLKLRSNKKGGTGFEPDCLGRNKCYRDISDGTSGNTGTSPAGGGTSPGFNTGISLNSANTALIVAFGWLTVHQTAPSQTPLSTGTSRAS
ncbi:hypothetical protein DFH08DRAFT_812585 [Mycena albidolilacea]|uniref:HAT C-terminal dimerisation domain-containing protein n=1 Tax=Mycena albidolilacea TaxID=1033008 RepID=A0AAD6ZTQ3_9AGAR|nr:hypothetical protein DFH08DRAFT_812585 [Mycena albidolilacea]